MWEPWFWPTPCSALSHASWARGAVSGQVFMISTQASSVRPLQVSKFAFTVANHFC